VVSDNGRNEPKVDLTWENAKQQTILIRGEVFKPRIVDFSAGMTAADAIAQAGGVTEFATAGVLRRRDTDARIDLAELADIPLKPGDHLMILPER
jgi:protein involved in polysaccharide export with SLBB domain